MTTINIRNNVKNNAYCRRIIRAYYRHNKGKCYAFDKDENNYVCHGLTKLIAIKNGYIEYYCLRCGIVSQSYLGIEFYIDRPR